MLSHRDPEGLIKRDPTMRPQVEDEFDNSPDYVFLIKKNWGALLISELVMLNLKVTEMSCKLIFF